MLELPPPPPATSYTLLALREVALGDVSATPILRNVTLAVHVNMRLAVLGANGAGKSLLLAGLAGKVSPLAGSREPMKWLQVLHWDTASRDALDPEDETPLQFINRVAGGGVAESDALSLLNDVGIDQFAAQRPCGCLSSGERTRLAQCTLATAPKHVLILDEPTAFLGAAAVESLGASLAPERWAGGALIFATGARATCDALCPTHTALVHAGGVTLRNGPPTDEDWAALRDAPSLSGAAARDAAELAALHAAVRSVERRSDWFRWAHKEARIYVRREELVERLRSNAPTVVVDVRDDDAVGGHIRVALHLADEEFDGASVRAIFDRAREVASKQSSSEADADATVQVVLHCMESVQRGPRCARRLVVSLEAMRASMAELPRMSVHVLEGGFDQWCRRHWQDESLVEQYDDEIWGYEEMGGTSLFAHDEPSHASYERPADQAATPWSSSGVGEDSASDAHDGNRSTGSEAKRSRVS